MQVTRTTYTVTIFATLINLCTGFQYCWSLLGHSIIAEYGWSDVQAALPYSVLTIVTSFWAIAAGRIGENIAPKVSIFIGGLCLGLGLLISSTTTSPIIMTLSVGLFLGVASTSITSNTMPTAMKWAPDNKKGLVAGIVAVGMGVSSLYMAPLTDSLLDNIGIDGTFMVLGIGAIVLICGMSFFITTPPIILEERKRRKELKAQGLSSEQIAEELMGENADLYAEDNKITIYQNKVNANKALLKPEVYILFLLYFASWMPSHILNASVATIAEVQVGGWAGGALCIMMLAIGNGVGRLASSAISDRLGVFKTFMVLMVIACINMLLFSFYTTPVTFLIGTFIMGYCTGSGVPMIMCAVAQVFGRRYNASIFGYVAVSYGAGGLIAPLIANTGSYSTAYVVSAVFMVVGFLCALFLQKKYIRVINARAASAVQ